MTRTDTVSVIVVPLIGGEALASCLARLPDDIERIVILRAGDGDPDAWGRRVPGTRFIPAIADPVPLRRQQGVETATGEIAALLEDTTWPQAAWLDAVRAGFADASVAAVGGPVRISEDLPPRFQALGWSEYGAFTPNRFARLAVGRAGTAPFAVTRLPGNNMAYRRAELQDVLRTTSAGLVEGVVGPALRARGRSLAFAPDMVAEYAVADHHGAALRTRVNHGRLYAGAARGPSWPHRAALLAKAAVLPPVLLRRTVAAMAAARPKTSWLRVMLWAALIETAWAVGEGVGAVAGAGDSLERWR